MGWHFGALMQSTWHTAKPSRTMSIIDTAECPRLPNSGALGVRNLRGGGGGGGGGGQRQR